MKRFVVVVWAVFALTLTQSAEAVPITGGIAFGGDASPNTGDWDTATAVDFGNASPNAVVTGGISGSYVGIVPFVQTATFSDFTFDPALLPNPVSPLWTFTAPNGLTYSFTLTSVVEQLTGDNDDLTLAGNGDLSITGPGSQFDPTPGEWDFTGQESGQGVFSFSASNAAETVIPEPATMLLLGAGLAASARMARRHQRRG